MEVMHECCAGLDISKKDAKVCIRVARPGKKPIETITTWSAMTRDIVALREHLLAAQVTCVSMEATSSYWKPFYYLLEDSGFELVLANAADVKNMPGRKTDVSDATWLAQLTAHGLVRPAFVPPPPIRQLRDLTRTRTAITRERTREVQRLEKLLEDAGIKLSVVVSDITGVSSRAILRSMVAGERDPKVLADLSVRQLRRKIPSLIPALEGRFSDHHAFLVGFHLDLIATLDERIALITERIEEAMAPFRAVRELLIEIPGISTGTADVIIAETGGDMSVFPSADHLASWAGVAPGHHESAGRRKSGKTRHGNRYLKGALGAAVLAIARHPGTALHAKYKRLANSTNPQKAIVALERTLLTIIWTMLTNNVAYIEHGPDYYQRRNPERTMRNAVRALESLGLDVTITPREVA
uniref:IS110 family transposase n=1 Tax=Gordonia sp. B7-2 TaxID=3420932 RepID=UPI003D922971